MKDNNLISYLKEALLLESEQYKLTQICTRLQKIIDEEKRKILSENLSDYIHVANTPALLPNYNNVEKRLVRIGRIILFFFSLLMLIGIFSKDCNLLEDGKVFDYVILFIMLVSGILFVLCGKSLRNTRVSSTLNKIETQQRQERAAGESCLAEAKGKNAIVRNNMTYLQHELDENRKKLKKTSIALFNHYNTDLIHPIYRNFYCISKIFYLLDTGIVDKLEGVDGAYSQLRLDCIIDNQSIHNYLNSEILAQNYLMNKEISKTNDSIKQLEMQIRQYG